MNELGPVSQAMLDFIQERRGYVEIFRMINVVARRTGESHKTEWYFRRLVAMALEGRIEATVTRNGDILVIRFRRFEENGLEGLPEIEEAGG